MIKQHMTYMKIRSISKEKMLNFEQIQLLFNGVAREHWEQLQPMMENFVSGKRSGLQQHWHLGGNCEVTSIKKIYLDPLKAFKCISITLIAIF